MYKKLYYAIKNLMASSRVVRKVALLGGRHSLRFDLIVKIIKLSCS
jgi:hypothetical protein